MNSITVIILTFNEELHIERCITSLQRIASNIIIIDSFSTDNTVAIATSLGAKVYQNKWINYATQFNWALDTIPITTEWTMRFDCDEYLMDDLIVEINTKLPNTTMNVGGFILKRRVYFMNKWIRYGGFYPHRLLRIWRTGKARLEERKMDEHVVLKEGDIITFKHDFVDHNLNDLTWWINKHNLYATREMHDLIEITNNSKSQMNVASTLLGEQYSRKRWLKEKIYSNIPLFVRPFIYFFYRYFILLGFLDGRPGLVWHFLQGFWYRFLVDAKLYELKSRIK